ncbi:hypothetical protein OZX60_01590 [Streptococcaceae bacterium ESL0687]|nr:hypothetical protein OZX60_01590 [Streptococcaceae bacterium ESL0687]
MKKNSIKELTVVAILIAMGIAIPMVMPKIVIGPASFTLASHVPLFIAMFFSPGVAVLVALGTAFGFFLTTPIIIALRALSHLVFALIGSIYLQKRPDTVLSNKKFQIYNILIALIHTIVEMAVVAIFFFSGMGVKPQNLGYLLTIMALGGFVHSFIDYNIAYYVAKPLSKIFDIPVFKKAVILAKNK